LVGLTLLTVQLLPKAIEHTGYVLQIIQVQCTLETIIGATTTYPVGIILFGLFILWLKALIAVVRAILVARKTRLFSLQLDISDQKSDYIEFNSSRIEAFTLGLTSPQVFVSSAMIENFSAIELQSVVMHEEYHRLNFDPLRKLLMEFLGNILPYFPLKSALLKSYSVLNELAADNYAISKVDSQKGIVSALAKIFSTYNTNLALSGFALENDRINILLGKKQFQSGRFFTILSFVVFSLFIVGAKGIQINAEALAPQMETAIQCPAFRPFSPIKPVNIISSKV